MALTVAELLRLLAPSPERWEFALRQALICALTAVVVEIYQTPDPALTVYIVFFLNKPDRATSVILNLVLLVVITITVSMVILVSMVVTDHEVWLVASIAIISFVMLFLTSASKLRPVGNIIALIVGYGLDMLATFHSGEFALRGMLYAWLFVGIPAGVSLVVNLLIAPAPRHLVQRALARRLWLSARLLRGSDDETRDAFMDCLREGAGEIPAWLKVAALERTSPAADIAALGHAAEASTAIMLLVELITRDEPPLLPAELRDHAARELDDMAAILRAGGYPVEVTFDVDAAGLPPLAEAVLADLREAIIGFAEPPPQPVPVPAKAGAGGFFLPDAFTNEDHAHFALKVTAAAMFCYCLYVLLDWQQIHTCFITCYIVALTTAAEAVEKLVLRMLGCLLGAAAGITAIVYVTPALTSIGSLIGVVFAGAFVSAWVAAGSQRIAYAGFQIAFAFFLSMLQGPSPEFDMTIARDRVIGVLIGDIVSYLVFTRLWPVSVTRTVDPAISALLRRLSAMTTTVGVSARRAVAAQVLASRDAIETDLKIAAYEPRSTRQSQRWRRRRLRAVRAILALTGPLLLSADRLPAVSMEFGRRLRLVAHAPDDAEPPAEETAGGPATPEADHAQAEAVRSLLEPDYRRLRHAMAERHARV
jgi:multidrug resistance protein MdtO